MMAENTPKAIKYVNCRSKKLFSKISLTLINLIHISNITICLATVIGLGMGT